MIMINFNMGCIETRQNGGTTATKPRLTLTWDVLKRVRVLPPFLIYWINFNMGCIETCAYENVLFRALKINFNMRCIETIDS